LKFFFFLDIINDSRSHVFLNPKFITLIIIIRTTNKIMKMFRYRTHTKLANEAL
jgi:hypothetical protein